MHKKTAFYARISKASQHSNPASNSINSQISILYNTVQILNNGKTCKSCCIDINSIQVYTDDGYSGRNKDEVR